MLIDTHAHVYSEQFQDDFAQVEDRATKAGVDCILLPNIDEESISGLKKLVEHNPIRYKAMMGLHPCSVNADVDEVLKRLEIELDSGHYIAVGEIGIDLYWDKTFLKEQEHAFRTQIRWAKERNLPIAIHARDSFDEIFAILDEENDKQLKGVFHCFTGTREQAQHVLNYGGFKLGIGGMFTFKNSGLRDALTGIDPVHIVFETDAPYLAPVPHRGKRNEPAYTKLVAEAWSKTYGISVQEISKITTQNAKELFNL